MPIGGTPSEGETMPDGGRQAPTTPELLESVGACVAAAPTDSPLRFPDGSECRVEIPSVEDLACLEAVRDVASELSVPIARLSQGTGVTLLRDSEIRGMVSAAAEMGAELSLFARPGAGWGTSAMARSAAGAVVAASAHGHEQLVAAVDEIRRAADLGVRNVLIADLGVLSVFGRLRRLGHLPADMKAKVSVMLPAANPASARALVDLGADTLNLPTDLSVEQIASIRRAVEVPLDIYIESPDNLGGFVRYHELPRIIAVASPVYIKFGLRNSPDVYPSGTHLQSVAQALSAERVRRARLGLDMIERLRPQTDVGRRGIDVASPRAT
jgi:hypothetical protein